MTTPRYPIGCVAVSQVRGVASPSDYAWNVNFNNGNVNYNNQNNNGFVRACRRFSPGECQGAVSLKELYTAWKMARHQKVPSHNQAEFESRWIDHLLELQEKLTTGTWKPLPTTCFVAQKPKAREIHAPDFSDRVVHHWLVPQLERIYESGFIFDSHANRTDKGTHVAIERLQSFVRQVSSGQGGGYYLQLDIHNFFNSIHRPTLYALLKRRMVKCGLPETAQRAVHALLRSSPVNQGVVYSASAAERALVPAHKRLGNAAPGCGLPIGNLSSQFFANVYMDVLDQFIKHELKVRRYVRYVDDFVLVHKDREQLARWQAQIEKFLHERLRLRLKADIKLNPLAAGCDFLGYVIYPRHTRVRRRVVQHYREKLWIWQQQHVNGGRIRATPEQFRHIKSIAASYEGHFAHADSRGLRDGIARQFPWLGHVTSTTRRFDHRLDGRQIAIRWHA